MKSVVFVVYLLFLGNGVTSAQNQPQQGYVDYENIIQGLPEYAEGQKILDLLRKQFEDSVKIWMDIHLKHMEHIKKVCVTQQYIDSLKKFEEKLLSFQEFVQDSLSQKQWEIENQLKDIFIQELKKYCIDYNISLISDKKSVLYCNNCKNFTEDFRAYLIKNR